MINSLKNLFKQSEDSSNNTNTDLFLLCGIMIEAANIDGVIEKKEIEKISEVLINSFGEESSLVEIEIEKCLKQLDENKSLHFFTSKINKSFNDEKKLILIQTLWEIILADGQVHDFESNLIRRMAGLLYISDIQCGKMKKIALKNLNINE